MKKIVAGIAVLLCLATVFAGGGKEKAPASSSAAGVTEISLWTYPIGGLKEHHL